MSMTRAHPLLDGITENDGKARGIAWLFTLRVLKSSDILSILIGHKRNTRRGVAEQRKGCNVRTYAGTTDLCE